MSHASDNVLVSVGLSAGVRAFPDLSLSRLFVMSAARRERFTP